MQNAHCADLTQSVHGTLHRQVQSGIGFDVLGGAVGDERVYICSQVAGKVHDEVARSGRKLRRSFQAHHAPFSSHGWIDPGGDAATGSGRLNRAGGSGHADAAAIGFHFQRPGDIDYMDTAPAGLRPYGTAHFAEIDLAATGADAYETGSAPNGDIAADGIQIGAPANLPRANVTAATVERSVSRNVADVDVAAGRKCRKVSGNPHHFDVAAFRFQFGDGAAARDIANSGSADSSGDDVSALGFQESCTTNISGGDVATVRVDFHVVIAWHGDFKLHPELRIRVMCALGEE